MNDREVAMMNGQSWHNGNIGHKPKEEKNQDKNKENTENYKRGPVKKHGVNPGAHEGKALPNWFSTWSVCLPFNSAFLIN